MKIVTVVGARPQFIKAAVVSRAIAAHNQNNNQKLDEIIIHTGQHYDENMSKVFFHQLKITKPDWLLNCGNMESHTKMLSKMLTGIEKVLLKCRPDGVLVYGDTNSTLAGALAASQMRIPLFHVEAGLRSFNKLMSEERNRIVTDHLSSMLFCPTLQSIVNLNKEGITEGIHFTGDVMYDATLIFGATAEKKSRIIATLGLQAKKYRLCTVHRAENTDILNHLKQIVLALLEIATPDVPVIMPLHPRSKTFLEFFNLNKKIATNSSIRLINPCNYLDMAMLEKNAATILTDSGGVQKEAYFYRTPCITLRDETEWTETVTSGWNQLAGYRTEKILECLKTIPVTTEIDDYGDGHAAEKIVSVIAGR